VLPNPLGGLLASVKVGVYNASTATLATVWTTATLASKAVNPFYTDPTGVLSFWTQPGAYDIKLEDGLGRIAERRLPWDSVSGQEQGIAKSQLENAFLTNPKLAKQTLTATKFATAAVAAVDIKPNSIYPTSAASSKRNTVGFPTTIFKTNQERTLTNEFSANFKLFHDEKEELSGAGTYIEPISEGGLFYGFKAKKAGLYMVTSSAEIKESALVLEQFSGTNLYGKSRIQLKAPNNNVYKSGTAPERTNSGKGFVPQFEVSTFIPLKENDEVKIILWEWAYQWKSEAVKCKSARSAISLLGLT